MGEKRGNQGSGQPGKPGGYSPRPGAPYSGRAQPGGAGGKPARLIPPMERPLFQQIVRKEPALGQYVEKISPVLASTIEHLPEIWHRPAIIICAGIEELVNAKMQVAYQLAAQCVEQNVLPKVLPGYFKEALPKALSEVLPGYLKEHPEYFKGALEESIKELKGLLDAAVEKAVGKKLGAEALADIFKGEAFYGTVGKVVTSALEGEDFHKAAVRAAEEVLSGPAMHEAAAKAVGEALSEERLYEVAERAARRVFEGPALYEAAQKAVSQALGSQSLDDTIKKAVDAATGSLAAEVTGRMSSVDRKVENWDSEEREREGKYADIATKAAAEAEAARKELEATRKELAAAREALQKAPNVEEIVSRVIEQIKSQGPKEGS